MKLGVVIPTLSEAEGEESLPFAVQCKVGVLRLRRSSLRELLLRSA